MGSKYQYYVEGGCEKKFLRSFMYLEEGGFVEGRIDILNFVNERLTKAKIRTIKRGTKVVLVFDTDTGSSAILSENIEKIQKFADITKDDIILVPSVNNFEDELVTSCSRIKNIHDLFKTRGIDEFKNKFIKHNDIYSKLNSVEFDINKIWTKKGKQPFDIFDNNSNKIKK